MFSSSIFRANDIRGSYPKDFDLSFTKDLAFALLQICKEKNIKKPRFLIGRDARLSSPKISAFLFKHLKNQGADICSIDLAPSPLCYFLVHHYDLTACIVVTASHNPSEYNGFKVLFHRKYKIYHPVKNLKKWLLKSVKERKKVFPSPGKEFQIKKEEPYISSLKKEFSLKSLPFVIDTGNGALGPLAKETFLALGLKPAYLFQRPDGRFPYHHPDPTVEKNLFHLKKRLQGGTFQLGMGFDGDGDRLVILDQKGKSFLGDELGSLFLSSIRKAAQKQKRPALILADVKCSDWFFQMAKRKGLKVLMTKSGHGLIRAEMEKTKALMALDFSGHIFFNDRKDRGFDDALYAGLRLLEILNQEKVRISSLLPKISSERTPEIRVDMPDTQITKKLSKVRAYLRKRGDKFESRDGIRLSRKDSWALFRRSKTQPALTMRFEAPTKKRLLQFKKEFSKVMGFEIP